MGAREGRDETIGARCRSRKTIAGLAVVEFSDTLPLALRQAPPPSQPGRGERESHAFPLSRPRSRYVNTKKGPIVRPIEDLRKFRQYQRRFGIKEAIKKSLEHLAQRAGPPSAGPAYPVDVQWTMEGHPDVAEHAARTRAMNEDWLPNARPPRRVLWVMPDFISVHNGGPNTIRFAHYFRSAERKASSTFSTGKCIARPTSCARRSAPSLAKSHD